MRCMSVAQSEAGHGVRMRPHELSDIDSTLRHTHTFAGARTMAKKDKPH